MFKTGGLLDNSESGVLSNCSRAVALHNSASEQDDIDFFEVRARVASGLY
jgi:hypothetical protein